MPRRQPRDPSDKLMTEREVAEMLKCSVKTLRNNRSLGRGPKWVKSIRHVRYWQSDVLAWIK